jgi:hypothetical protein
MTRARVLFAVAIACLTAGCMGVGPQDLKAPRQATTLLLKTPIDYYTESIFGTKVFHMTIAAGAYKAVREDSGGVFYHGPAQCLTQNLIDSNQTVLQDCGVYIPNTASQPAKVYSVLGSSKASPSSKATSSDSINESVQSVVLQPAYSNLSPGAAGVAAGLGGAIATGLMEAQKGRFAFLTGRIQPPANTIRESFVKFPEKTGVVSPNVSPVSGPVSNPVSGRSEDSAQVKRTSGKDTYNVESQE